MGRLVVSRSSLAPLDALVEQPPQGAHPAFRVEAAGERAHADARVPGQIGERERLVEVAHRPASAVGAGLAALGRQRGLAELRLAARPYGATRASRATWFATAAP
jgi:hypothetical protein